MNYETEVLKAILRLSRRRNAAEADSILVRVGGQLSDLRAALRKLEQSGLINRIGDTGGSLTLPGLAVAVAAAATKAKVSHKRRSTDVQPKREVAPKTRKPASKPRAA